MVSTTTAGCACPLNIRRRKGTALLAPSRPGMPMSEMTLSHSQTSSSSARSCVMQASPTTSICGVAYNNLLTPARTQSWSSATMTRILSVIFFCCLIDWHVQYKMYFPRTTPTHLMFVTPARRDLVCSSAPFDAGLCYHAILNRKAKKLSVAMQRQLAHGGALLRANCLHAAPQPPGNFSDAEARRGL